MAKYVSIDKLLYFKQKIMALLNNKVDKVSGKQLSTNDLTTELKANYDKAYTHSTSTHAPTNAQANVIETVKVNGVALVPTTKAVNVTVPTKTSQITNDSGFLTSVPAEYVTETELNGKGYQTSTQVNSAITSKGYQTSTQVQSAINNALKGVTGIEFSVVTQLPSTGTKGVIYLIASQNGNQDVYDEYIWVTDKFEKLGNTDIDLSGYYKKTDLVECSNQDIDNLFV